MAKSSIVSVKIIGDAKPLKESLSEAGDDVQKFGVNASKAFAGAAVAVGAAAVAVGTALVKMGDQFDEMENAIIRGTGASGAALDGLLDNALDIMAVVPQSGEEVAAALADVNTYFGSTGRAAEVLTKLFLDFARVGNIDVSNALYNTRGVMTLFGVEVSGISELLGDFVRISQATGEPLETLISNTRRLGPYFQSFGYDVEETIAILGMFSRAGVDASTVSTGLARFLGEVAAAGEDPRTALEELAVEIQGATTDAEALSLATEAFGQRSAALMSNALRQGAVDLQNFDNLLGSSYNVVNDQAAAVTTLGDQWSIVKNNIFVALQPIATRLFEKLEGFVKTLAPKIKDLGKELEKFLDSKQFKDFKKAFEDAFKKFIDIAEKVIGVIAEWIEQNPEAFFAALAAVVGIALTGAVWALFTAVSALLSPFYLVVAVIIAIAAAVTWAYFEFETFRTIVDVIWDVLTAYWKWLAEAVGEFIGFFVDMGAAIWDFASSVVDVVLDIIENFGDIIDFFRELPGNIWTAITNTIGKLIDAGKEMASKLLDGLMTGLQAAGGFVTDLADTLADAFVNAVKWALNNLVIKPINFAIEVAVDALDVALGPFVNFPKVDNFIPELASGGIIKATPGGTLARIGEGGRDEAVIPLTPGMNLGGGSTFNITINMPAGANGEDVIEAIQQETRWRGETAFPVRTDRRR